MANPKAKFGRTAVTLALATQDLLIPVLDRLNQTLQHLNSGELLAARGAFIEIPEQINEIDFLLKMVARVAKVEQI